MRHPEGEDKYELAVPQQKEANEEDDLMDEFAFQSYAAIDADEDNVDFDNNKLIMPTGSSMITVTSPVSSSY